MIGAALSHFAVRDTSAARTSLPGGGRVMVSPVASIDSRRSTISEQDGLPRRHSQSEGRPRSGNASCSRAWPGAGLPSTWSTNHPGSARRSSNTGSTPVGVRGSWRPADRTRGLRLWAATPAATTASVTSARSVESPLSGRNEGVCCPRGIARLPPRAMPRLHVQEGRVRRTRRYPRSADRRSPRGPGGGQAGAPLQGRPDAPWSSRIEASTWSEWPSAFTFGQVRAMTPSGSMRKVARATPIDFLP
jgi:hypothetical protein